MTLRASADTRGVKRLTNVPTSEKRFKEESLENKYSRWSRSHFN